MVTARPAMRLYPYANQAIRIISREYIYSCGLDVTLVKSMVLIAGCLDHKAMKKRRVANNSGIKHREIRRQTHKTHPGHKPSGKRTGNKWEWDDEDVISDLGF